MARPSSTLRVYRAEPSPLLTSEAIAKIDYLCPPAIEKNYLISPPGSPQVGWKQIKEDPPNPTPLADDIIAALNKLTFKHMPRGSREVLLEPEDDDGVSVYVQFCDTEEFDEEEDWLYGEPSPARLNWRPVPTALPPMVTS
jgi:hypothetical protein